MLAQLDLAPLDSLGRVAGPGPRCASEFAEFLFSPGLDWQGLHSAPAQEYEGKKTGTNQS